MGKVMIYMLNSKVSIIVPVYNVEKYIEKCIVSLLEQTYTNIEIIIVNDGSTDNSGNLCAQLKKRDDRIKVYHKKNGGLSSARNYGIKKSTGDYLAFIDSDDYVSHKMIENLLQLSCKTDSDIIICNYCQFFENSEANFSFDEKYEVLEQEEALKLLFLNKIDNYAWNKLYKKSVFQNLEFPDGKNFEDIGTTYKAFLNANFICITEAKLYGYLQRSNSLTGNISKKSMNDYIDLTLSRYNYIIERKPNLTKEIRLNYLFSVYSFFKESIKFFPNDTVHFSKLDAMYLNCRDILKEYGFLELYKNMSFSKKDKFFAFILYKCKVMYKSIMKVWYKVK